MTADLHRLSRKKHRLFKLASRTKLDSDWGKYTRVRKDCNREFKKAKRRHLTTFQHCWRINRQFDLVAESQRSSKDRHSCLSHPWHGRRLNHDYLSGSKSQSLCTFFCVPVLRSPFFWHLAPGSSLPNTVSGRNLWPSPSHGSRSAEQSLQAVTLQVIRLSTSDKSRAARSCTLQLPVTYLHL